MRTPGGDSVLLPPPSTVPPPSSSLNSSSMPHRNAANVLPEPVGARIRVWSPRWMAGQPCAWGGVGWPKVSENHVLTGKEKVFRISLIVHLPGDATDPDASVVRLEFPGSLTITQQPCATPGSDGTLSLLALDADPFGAVGGNITVAGSGAGAYLTGWKHANYRVEYRVKTGTAGKWKVEADIAAPDAAKLSLNIGKSSQAVDVPATGDGITWKTLPLGIIELPADETVIELKPDPEHWKPIHLRSLKLTPVAE